MKYRANPVIVEAQRIKTVRGNKDSAAGGASSDFVCLLENGTEFRPHYTMTSRMTPVPGDYVVVQDDGYTYLNPKDVFERKYAMVRPLQTPSQLQDESHAAFREHLGINGETWADEFLKRFQDKLHPLDRDVVVGWFANAIEAGRAAGAPASDFMRK